MNEPNRSVGAIFDAAMALPPERRADYLQVACAGDAALRQRVEALLRAHESSDSFMAAPAIEARPETPVAKPTEQAGDRIGRYKLLQQIGEGGCGVVYMAEQEEPVHRRVALKVIKVGMDTKNVIARFEAERQALALMDHPNIAKVLDAGATEAGRPYFVMELVKAIPITRFCDENNLSTATRLDLFVQVCQAIQHAHQKGIIHRDIKPSNILVADHDGVPVPKIIDFGIAKATSDQRLTDKTLFTAFEQFIGTPAYMSPEQAKLSGLDIDTRSDIYSLGVLLYELLTGKTPFEAKRLLDAGLDEVRRIIREEEPVKPSTRLHTLDAAEQTTVAKRRQSDPPKLEHLVRGDLDWIVMKALEKDRVRRYETANGLALDVQRHLGNEPVLARPPSAAYRLQKSWRRNKTAFTAAILMAVVLVAATIISATQAVRATHAEALATQRLAESDANATLAKQRLAESEANAALAKQRLAESKTNEALANDRLAESEAVSKFLTEVFRSPDPARDGRTNTVVDALGAAAKKLETDLASQPARQAQLQDTLGRTYFALGFYGEAIKLQERVRNYLLANFGPEDPATLTAMHILANSYYYIGRQKEALKLREQVLSSFRKVRGTEDLDTLRAQQNLAISYEEANRQEEALKLREQVVAIRRKIRGPDDPDTLGAMNDLANSFVQTGHKEEALKLREQVLELRRKVNGPERPDTLIAMHNLAVSYATAGRWDEALNLREQVLDLRRKVLGPRHPDTIMAMGYLAGSYYHAGRRNEALKLREEALALSLEVSGTEHPETLEAMTYLSISYEDAGRRDEALQLREQALALRSKVSGVEHSDTLIAMYFLAKSYDDAGRRDEALKLREKLLELRRKVSGAENQDTLDAMQVLANSYSETNRTEEALKLREEVLVLCRKVIGTEHPSTLIAMHNLANSYQQLNRWEEAFKLQEQLLAIYRKIRGPDQMDTILAMNDLANSYLAVGRSKEALAMMAQAVDGNPKDSLTGLVLAAWQTWLGQDANYEATRCRLVQQAEGTDQPTTAERAAKAYCLRSSTNTALLAQALGLAQRAVNLGQSDSNLPWFQLTLGLAEYRNGQYEPAERSLSVAQQMAGGDHNIQGIACSYRAMSLFGQHKLEEAKELLRQAEAQLPQLPKDESKALVDGKLASHDDLIRWLASKEAKALIEGSSPPAAAPSALK